MSTTHTTHVLYLHGFRSSPQSFKARLVAGGGARQHPRVTLWCPQLPPSPQQAMERVMQGLESWRGRSMAVLGSSLGGFYASWVAQQCRCPSVLLNPAVQPARDLERYIGEQTQWHNPQEAFYFRPEYIAQLQALDVSDQAPVGAQLLIAAQGDEVLDWREMLARYPQAQQLVLDGGDHALSDFAQHLPRVLEFLDLA